jgi:hypothetical protein
MDIPTLLKYLDHPGLAGPWLIESGFRDRDTAHRNLVNLARSGITLDLLAIMVTQLEQTLPRLADPDVVLACLDRFIAASRSPLALGSLFERDPTSLPTLLQVFRPVSIWRIC